MNVSNYFKINEEDSTNEVKYRNENGSYMERRQAVHANKIQALMLMITVMQIPEKEKNRKILKAVRVSTALLWLLTCVEDLGQSAGILGNSIAEMKVQV